MGARELVAFARLIAVAELEILQFLEELDRSAPGNSGGGQVLCARGVGARFLRTVVGEELAHGRLLTCHQHAHRGLAAPCGCGCHAEQQREQGNPGCGLRAGVEHGVSASHVAKLVRDHALDLACRACLIDKAAVEVNRLPADHEGIDRGVVDENDIDVLRLESGGLDQRRGHVGEQPLGFGIAKNRLRRDRPCGEDQHGKHGGEQGDSVAKARHGPL